MCLPRTCLAIVLSLVVGIPALGQESATTSATSAAQRDLQALAVLSQCLNAMGASSAIGAIQDFTAAGNITYSWAGEQIPGSVAVRGKGITAFRLDAVLSVGSRSWAVSNGAGSLLDTNGTTYSIPHHNALNLGSLTVPLFAITAALQDSTTSVLDLGPAIVDGIQTRHLQIQQNFPSSADPQGTFSKLTLRDLFIDSTTLLPLKILDMTHPVETSMENYSHEILFSNYRPANGVLVPFTVSEKIAGQLTFTIKLDQIAFNQGLTDADFQP